ncbi:hypothetical protein HPB47_009680, partial [Ixodes persulcatus]
MSPDIYTSLDVAMSCYGEDGADHSSSVYFSSAMTTASSSISQNKASRFLPDAECTSIASLQRYDAMTKARSLVLVLAASTSLASALFFGDFGTAEPLERRQVIDVSWSLNNHTVYFNNEAHFIMNVTLYGDTAADWHQEEVITTATHGGTHFDAPLHFYKDGWSVSEVPLERLVFPPVALVDIQKKVASNDTYQLSAGDLRDWERQHGRLPTGCVVFLRTGWYKKYFNRTAYRNQDADGVFHYPAIGPDAGNVSGPGRPGVRYRHGLGVCGRGRP